MWNNKKTWMISGVLFCLACIIVLLIQMITYQREAPKKDALSVGDANYSERMENEKEDTKFPEDTEFQGNVEILGDTEYPEEMELTEPSEPDETVVMSNIRVLLYNTDYQSYFHKSVSFKGNTEVHVFKQNADGTESELLTVPQDTEIHITDFPLLEEGEQYTLRTQNGKITLLSVLRAQGNPSYAGIMEIHPCEKGYYLINEVDLEKYLYSVVPSEMPSSYALEALKAQAVCARTYAYNKILDPGLLEYGADLDDSNGFQVYNNIETTENTNRAVDETKGQILMYEGIPVETYFYSTSCGVSADETVWSAQDDGNLAYFKTGIIQNGYADIDLSDETEFESFITQTDYSHYEANEAFYRWSYEVDKIDAERILRQIQARYEVTPYFVLCKNQKNEYVSSKPEKLGTILDISAASRDRSGSIDALIITGEKATYKLLTNNVIRYVLADPDLIIELQDGTTRTGMNMLPSAFFIVTQVKENDKITSYYVIGGGFGHGVGMSQNAAGVMAEQGMNYQDILQFFYQNTTLCEGI